MTKLNHAFSIQLFVLFFALNVSAISAQTFKMTQNLFYILLAGLIFFSGCKDNSVSIIDEGDTLDQVTTLFNLQKGAAVVYKDALSATGDTIRALDALGQWVVDQPEVEKAYYVGLNLVEIHLTNGLRTDILLIPVDADGQHLIRGGGTGNVALKKFSGMKETREIDNAGVLVLIPFFQEFYYSHWDKESLFAGGSSDAPQPSDVTLLTGTDVTLSELELMDDAGLIILNTHGVSDGFLLNMNDNGFDLADTSKFSKADMKNFIVTNNNLPLDKITNGELRLSTQFNRDIISKSLVGIKASLTVTEEYVRNMGIDLSGSVLFANHCYSGWVADGNTKNNMSQAWLSKGLSTYYGYAYENGGSAAVGNKFCKTMEDSLIVNLVQNTDSTGEAHLAPDGSIQFELLTKLVKRREVEKKKLLATMTVGSKDSPYEKVNTPLYFYQYLQDDYQYKGCPNLVDSRDDKKYQTACIGDQVWMAENLNYSKGGEGVCYDNSSANCDEYGRLYSGQELNGGQISTETTVVQGLCPKGWHVPSEAEYKELIEFSGGMAEAIEKLRSVSGWPDKHSDEFGFNLKPAGHFVKAHSVSYFSGMGSTTHLWTSTLGAGHFITTGEDYRAVNNSFGIGNTSPAWKYYCRCIMDQDQ